MNWIKAVYLRWDNLHPSHKQSIKDVLKKGTCKSSNQGFTSEQQRWVEGEDVPSLKKKDSVVKSQKGVKSQEKEEK